MGTWIADKAWPYVVQSFTHHPIVWIVMAGLCLFGWKALEAKADGEDVKATQQAVATVQSTLTTLTQSVTIIEKRQQLRDMKDRRSRIRSDLLSIERDMEKFKKERQPIDRKSVV